MLYKDLDDCSQCPFLDGMCNHRMTSSLSGNPIDPPCTCWSNDDDLDKLYSEAIESKRRYEESEDKSWKRGSRGAKEKAKRWLPNVSNN